MYPWFSALPSTALTYRDLALNSARVRMIQSELMFWPL